VYFLILCFGLDLGFFIKDLEIAGKFVGRLYMFETWPWHVLLTVVVIGIDAGLAYFFFEWFLPFFRERMQPPIDEW